MDQKNDQHKSFTERVRDHRLLSTFALLGTLSLGVVAGSVLTGTVHGAQQSQVDTRDATPLRIPSPVTETSQFATIAKQVGPAVVKINIEQLPKQSTAPRAQRRGRRSGGDGEGGDQGDMQDFFNHFFGGQGGQGGQGGGDDEDGPAGAEKRALGSGFIVDPRGYIITNNHVVDKADRIYVKLASDAETDLGHVGHVVGVDKDTDIAVVKIDSSTPLPTVKMGNSDAEQLGDWVLAIGSPFDLSQTVTAGIVSAKNRSIGEGQATQFQRFIQTDAAINPGNSGGPLLNMQGEVIGVNTAIFTQSGGAAGVGFAVPSNTVIDVYNMLISPEHKVVRGSIGISFQPGQSSAVGRIYGFAKGGVLISSVTPGMPAAKAGLQPQDVITSIDGKPVKDGDDLVGNISARRPGSTVRLGYLRAGKEESATVGIANRADTVEAMNGKQGGDDQDGNADQPDQPANFGKLGITVQAIPANVLQQKKLSGGVLVTDVKPGSFAEDLSPFGLNKGDIILEVNRKAVTDAQSFRTIINSLKSGDDVVFVVRPGQARDRTNSFVGGTLP